MVQYCVVPGCKNAAAINGVSFFSFPRDCSLRKQWITKIRRDEKRNVQVSPTMRVCSEHFSPEDIIYKKNRKILRPNAIPSLFSFTSPRKLKKRKRIQWLDRHCLDVTDSTENCDVSMISTQSDTALFHSEEGVTDSAEEFDISTTSVQSDISLLRLVESITDSAEVCEVTTESNHSDMLLHSIENLPVEHHVTKNIEKVERENAVLQARIEYLENRLRCSEEEKTVLRRKITFLESHRCEVNTLSNIKEDKILFYTGFDNVHIYKAFQQFINPNQKTSFNSKIPPNDQVFLFLMKLRHGFSNIDLASRFGICEKAVSSIFINWLNVAYSRLGSLNIWPDRKIILSNAPDEFKTKFPNTILILDCTECRIECPSDLVRQSQSYSSYKSHNTVKGLIGCSPAGGIMFISSLFTGSISDKQITEKSGLYEVLKEKLSIGEILPGDSVMVDKGFAIKDELKKCGLEINVPPLASDHQFVAAEVQETRKIASCRVHVERAIRKIKTHKILSGVIPIKMMPHINQIWTVCALLSNFRCILKMNLDDSLLSDAE